MRCPFQKGYPDNTLFLIIHQEDSHFLKCNFPHLKTNIFLLHELNKALISNYILQKFHQNHITSYLPLDHSTAKFLEDKLDFGLITHKDGLY